MTTKTDHELELELALFAVRDQLESVTNAFSYTWPEPYEQECRKAIAAANDALGVPMTQIHDINDDPFWAEHDKALGRKG